MSDLTRARVFVEANRERAYCSLLGEAICRGIVPNSDEGVALFRRAFESHSR